MKIFQVLRRLVGAHTASSDERYPRESSDPELIAMLQTVINSGELDQKKKLVKMHPELLSVEADLLLGRGADERTREVLSQYRQLFDLCRIHGVDEAFRQVEEERDTWQSKSEAGDHFMRALGSKDVAELELTVRQDPRIIDVQWRDLLRSFIAAGGALEMSMGHILRCLDILESCERRGIDATFAALDCRASLEEPGWPDSPKTKSIST